MPELWLKKAPNGSLFGADEEALEYLCNVKMGALLHATVKQPRNAKFHRKLFALIKWAFDNTDHPEIEYKGKTVSLSFDRFRSDLTIMSGHYDTVANIRGDVRAEAHSLSFAKCSQDKAEQIYNDMLNTISKKLFGGRYTAKQLDELTEQFLEFC